MEEGIQGAMLRASSCLALCVSFPGGRPHGVHRGQVLRFSKAVAFADHEEPDERGGEGRVCLTAQAGFDPLRGSVDSPGFPTACVSRLLSCGFCCLWLLPPRVRFQQL